jgi:Domain of unknown function (DUF4465)
MKIKTLYSFIILLLAILVSCTDEDTFRTEVADFEGFELTEQSYWIGSDASEQFHDGNKIFNNVYYPDWNSWSGFAYSNVENSIIYNDIAKYAAIAGWGAEKSENYACVHQFEKVVIDFVQMEEPRVVRITNSTYTYFAIKYGYDYAKKFGGRDGSEPDWFKLTITGIGYSNEITGTVDFFLADYRFDNNEDDYIVGNWNYVDLRDLGIVKSLEFELSSSDAGTPLYFCMDDLKGRIHY